MYTSKNTGKFAFRHFSLLLSAAILLQLLFAGPCARCGSLFPSGATLALLPAKHVDRVFLLITQIPGAPGAPIKAVPKASPKSEPDTSEADKKPKAKRRTTSFLDRIDWVSWGIYGGIGAVVVVVIVVAYKQNKGQTAPPHVSSDVIGGYRLQNLMMTGQTSQVWEVVEQASHRHFAMKFLLPEKVVDEEHRKMLYHEATVGIELAHPNIIKIVKMVKDQHNPYFVMEFFPAGNLKLRVMHKKWDFIHEKAHDIFRQAATALAYMNASGWVHRDVKPDNIMVNSAGEVRLIDFALAIKVSKRGLFGRRRGPSAGTRSYMSPEQIRGEHLDGRADIYSFGISLYEVVTGRPPFRAASPEDLLRKHITEKPASPKMYSKDVTDGCADLIMRCISKKREDRPKDFHEVLMALRTIQIFKVEKPQAGQKV
jgi:serine/threonine-protein kinase